jgi:CRP/FNR family transcriptional regulator, anaerobic regulatory protein
MDSVDNFPLDRFLSAEERNSLRANLSFSEYSAGTVFFDSCACKGILFVLRGVVRVLIRSESGREITLYRLFESELCTLSFSCLQGSLPVEAIVKADTDCRIATLPSEYFVNLQKKHPDIKDFLLETMTARLGDVMWVVDQVAFRGMDRRIGEYLLSQPSPVIYSTHEDIAFELGTAREVVSRMLKYFERSGFLELSRGKMRIIDPEGLRKSFS